MKRFFPILPLLPVVAFFIAAVAVFAQTPAVPPPASRAPVWGYQIVRAYPHDPEAFTQGLEYLDGFLYEGTGWNGRSSIRKVKFETQPEDLRAQEDRLVRRRRLFEVKLSPRR